MKISKQSNKFSFILVVSFLLTQISFAAEKVDNIWKVIENKDISNEVTKKKKDLNEKEIIQGVKIKLTDENIVVNKELDESNILLAGLYDPAENDLNLDMWSNSSGKDVRSILEKINSIELSNFSKKIMDIALLTNSYLPKNNISSEEFQNFTV